VDARTFAPLLAISCASSYSSARNSRAVDTERGFGTEHSRDVGPNLQTLRREFGRKVTAGGVRSTANLKSTVSPASSLAMNPCVIQTYFGCAACSQARIGFEFAGCDKYDARVLRLRRVSAFNTVRAIEPTRRRILPLPILRAETSPISSPCAMTRARSLSLTSRRVQCRKAICLSRANCSSRV